MEEKGEATRGTEWKRIEMDWKGRAKKSMEKEKKGKNGLDSLRDEKHGDGRERRGAERIRKGNERNGDGVDGRRKAKEMRRAD